MTDDSHDAIKHRAYEIWLEDGCPEGAHENHWARAEKELHGAKSAAAATSGRGDPPPELENSVA